jgi:hypothetical protein
MAAQSEREKTMITQSGRSPARPRVLFLTSLLVGIGGSLFSADPAGVDLLGRYPTTLTGGDANPYNARPWEFTESDVFRLSGFSLQVGEALRVETGPADVGIGHGVDGAVWAAVIPREGGTLTSQVTNRVETISHVWLRFHPKEVDRVFPPETVFADADRDQRFQMTIIASSKFRNSWHAGANAMIPDPKDMTVDIDTKEGLRRFFAVDVEAETANYYAAMETRAVPIPPVLSPALAQAAFDQLWETFDRDYAMFVLRPEVDWANLREQYRPLALTSKSSYEFAFRCANILKPLRDLHVWLTLAGVDVPVFDRPRPANANSQAYQRLLGDLYEAGNRIQWAVTADKIGFIAVYGWTEDSIPAQFDEVLEQMRDTRGLIIDVRLNGGGDELLARQAAGRFLDREVVYAYSQYRNGPKHSDLTEKTPRKANPGGPWRYNRPVVLLIGQRCMSSNESFVAMMAAAPQVVTMGDHTAGSSGNPETVNLPLGITVSVPRWIDYLADGTPLDERGIVPQVPFTGTAEAFQADRDDLLSAALARLKEAPLPEKPIESPKGLDPVFKSKWPGYPPGPSQAVVVSGNYAYLASEALLVIDINNPASPRLAGYLDLGEALQGVAVSSNYAYAVSGGNLHVIDIANPAKPQRVGQYDSSGTALAVAVTGLYAYVTDGNHGLQVIDVADPTQPHPVGGYETSLTTGAVAVSSQFAYIADGTNGLQVIDISDPTNPRCVGRYDTSGTARAVAVMGHYAYVADGSSGLQVIDITNPTEPRRLGGCSTLFEAQGLAVSGNYAYVVSWAGMDVIDVSNPAKPQLLGSCTTSAALPGGVAVSGHYVYLAGQQGLQVIDVSSPTIPERVGWYHTDWKVYGVAVSGKYTYVSLWMAGLVVIDTSDPAHPQSLGRCLTRGASHGLAVSGDYAYVAVGMLGLDVIDIRNPAEPRVVGSWSFETYDWHAWAVALSGVYAYVADGHGLRVLDISDPVHPHQVGRWASNSDTLLRMALAGNYVYLTDYFAQDDQQFFFVIDIGHPGEPRQVGALRGADQYVRDLAVSGNYAYVTSDLGLQTIDTSDPVNPRLVSDDAWRGGTGYLAVSGDYAFASNHPEPNLLVFDITNPVSPRQVGRISGVHCEMALVVQGDGIYVCAGSDGLIILERCPPPSRFELPFRLEATGFRLFVRGEPGQAIRLQRSQDLKTWEDWMIMPGTGSSQEVVDPSALSRRSQFYRAVVP